MTDNKNKEAGAKAEKEAKEKAKREAEIKAKEKEEAGAKAEKEAEEKAKNTYVVSVTGFFALGKMFRANQELKGSQYKNHIPGWLKDGKIKLKSKK